VNKIGVQRDVDQARFGLAGHLELVERVAQQRAVLDDADLARMQLVVEEASVRREGHGDRELGVRHERLADDPSRDVLGWQRALR
jgi:hypothetical protein